MTAATAAELARLPLFASLNADEREAAASLFSVRAYPQDAIAIRSEHARYGKLIAESGVKLD